jgi:GMP synthase (glutamine-hydrolysing)
MTKKTLGILQAGRTPEELSTSYADYNQLFVDLLGEDSFQYRHWAVLDDELPNSINDADAWLITGSRHGAYEEHSWIPPLEQFIREVHASGGRMVGICFGHQIIAKAMGGKVEKFDGGWSVGRVEYLLDTRVFGTDPTTQTALMAFHQDQVVEIPEGARNVGGSGFCEHAALLYGSTMLTIQPHPEFNSAYVAGLIEARGDILPDTIIQNAKNDLNEPIQADPIAQSLKNFLNGSALCQQA